MKRWLFRLARTYLFGRCVRWIFAHMSFVIPLHRLRETKTLLAFYHPKPAYPVHVLIVPRRDIPDLMHLSPADQDFMLDLFQTVQDLVRELDLERSGYRLISNSGRNQDVPILHFHLIADLVGNSPEKD